MIFALPPDIIMDEAGQCCWHFPQAMHFFADTWGEEPKVLSRRPRSRGFFPKKVMVSLAGSFSKSDRANCFGSPDNFMAEISLGQRFRSIAAVTVGAELIFSPIREAQMRSAI